jgi:hypothetical protein
LKLFYEWQEGKDGEWWRDSSVIYVIYWKNFCKCHNVSPPSTIKNK